MMNELRPLVVIPAELEYYAALPGLLEGAGFGVRQAGDRGALASIISETDVLLTSVFLGVDRELLLQARQLRGVVSLIIGVDNVDVAACTELGLIVANGPVPENPVGTAEATVLLLVALLKRLRSKEIAVRSGQWRPESGPGHQVWRKTIGIVGVGRIGRAVAQRLQGWDVTLLGTSRSLTQATAPSGMSAVKLDELL